MRGTAAALTAQPCSALHALAPPLPSGENSMQLAPAGAQQAAFESLSPLDVVAPAMVSCSASALASSCPSVAASPNMSMFMQREFPSMLPS